MLRISIKRYFSSESIVNDMHHPGSSHFELMKSGLRYRSIATRTNRFGNSFFPSAVCAMNGIFNLVSIICSIHISLCAYVLLMICSCLSHLFMLLCKDILTMSNFKTCNVFLTMINYTYHITPTS